MAQAYNRASTKLSVNSPSDYATQRNRNAGHAQHRQYSEHSQSHTHSNSTASIISTRTSSASRFDLVTLLEASNQLTTR